MTEETTTAPPWPKVVPPPLHSADIGKLALALSTAQAQMGAALKCHKVDTGKYAYTYADLAGIIDMIRKPLTDNEIAWTQQISEGSVVTMLIHSSGEWIASRLRIPPTSANAQAIGSAITYARRYALAALAGVAQTDDDGFLATAQLEEEVPFESETQRKYVAQILECYEMQDAPGIEQLFDEMSQGEEKGVWKYFNTKEKAGIRELRKQAAVAGNLPKVPDKDVP